MICFAVVSINLPLMLASIFCAGAAKEINKTMLNSVKIFFIHFLIYKVFDVPVRGNFRKKNGINFQFRE